jgi:asparagine synthase (glutamine-hydrolysing)
MCGIAGILNFDGLPVDEAQMAQMCHLLRHRGPDDAGWFVQGALGIANTRLKIIDLSQSAHQPIFNEDRSVAVVLNGEIYNYRELRSELLKRGHVFRSQSDTEVIVHLYEEHGADCVEKLDGMFALAIWDTARRRLLLARDRVGKKPLFYYASATCIVFASEIKALFAQPAVPRTIDTKALPVLLAFGYVPCPGSIYSGIRQLGPGSWLTINQNGRLEQHQYWDIRPQPRRISTHDAREGLRRHLESAVQKRLVSDVPLGIFLSGGVDSSIIAAVASRLTPTPVRTFTVGFEGAPDFDERGYARLVAERLGTEHQELVVGRQSAGLVEELVRAHDQPFMDSSAIPTYLVSQLAREYVTVILNGDGGDEMFAGYRWFQAALAAAKSPNILLRVLGMAAGPMRALRPDVARILARFAASTDVEPELRLWALTPMFSNRLWEALRPEYADPECVLHHARELVKQAAGFTPLSRLLYFALKDYLLNDLNVKMDRCTMAHGLEARSPFLDTKLIEFVATLPDSMKLHGTRTKPLLRETYRDWLPPEIFSRKKQGFGVPLTMWFRDDLKDFVRDALMSPNARICEYLEPRTVEKLIRDFLEGRDPSAHTLWTLLTLEIWLRQEAEALSLRSIASEVIPAQ